MGSGMASSEGREKRMLQGRPGDEQALDSDGLGWVRVWYQQDVVCLEGSGERVCLPVEAALQLLGWLRQAEPLLCERMNQYYDCRECGSSHHRLVTVCPTLQMTE